MNCSDGASYCRALLLPGSITGTINQFKIKIVGYFRLDNISNYSPSLSAGHSETGGLQFANDVFQFGGPQGLAGKFYKVEMRLPVPISSFPNSNTATDPCTKW